MIFFRVEDSFAVDVRVIKQLVRIPASSTEAADCTTPWEYTSNGNRTNIRCQRICLALVGDSGSAPRSSYTTSHDSNDFVLGEIERSGESVRIFTSETEKSVTIYGASRMRDSSHVYQSMVVTLTFPLYCDSSSADNLCKQFGLRSGPTKCRS